MGSRGNADRARNDMTRNGRTVQRSSRWAAIGVSLVMASTGCTFHDVQTPELDGPSETGLSIQLTLSKDVRMKHVAVKLPRSTTINARLAATAAATIFSL